GHRAFRLDAGHAALDRARRAPHRLRHQARQWLHLGPRHLRAGAALGPLRRRRRRLLLRRHRDGARHGSCRMSATLRLPYLATAAVSGLLFGAGLYVSQMVDPYKVLNFLNFAAIPSGGWDPSLALVMVGGLVVMFFAVRYARGRAAPLFDEKFHEPEYKR